jgi:hypothetical protein
MGPPRSARSLQCNAASDVLSGDRTSAGEVLTRCPRHRTPAWNDATPRAGFAATGLPDARLLKRNFRILQAELMNVGINAPGDELGWHSLVEVSQSAVSRMPKPT